MYEKLHRAKEERIWLKDMIGRLKENKKRETEFRTLKVNRKVISY
jgi:predicted CopG family antitoxin